MVASASRNGFRGHPVEGALGDGSGATADGHGARLNDLADVVAPERGEQCLQLFGCTHRLNDERVGGDVNDVSAEQVDDLEHLRALTGIRAHLDE